MSQPHPRRGLALVVTAAVFFGINAGVTRIPIEAGLPVATYTTIRVTFAWLVFFAIAVAFDRSALRRPRGRDFLLVLALGVVGVAFVQWTYNIAIVRLPIGVALLLEYLAPVLVVLWARFVRHERVHPRVWPAIALALVGLALVGQVWGGLELDGIGVLVALTAAVCFAAYFLIGEELTATSAEPLSALQTVVWSFGIGAIVMNVLGGWEGTSALGTTASMLGRLDHLTVPAWLAMTSVVVTGTVVPFFLYLASLRDLSSAKASVIAMLEPVVAVIVGWVWFAESLSPVQTAGVAAVIGGIVLAQTARHTPDDELPPTL
ncbi:EamA family transporter [Aeromicrobium duanguangcaii]|uniref:EamA family transporter n=1 Tax=Aeromicrobium duanguangcaii TaxID=2968086 RepID=A0ABY5KD05_9ACTN|nr:EamA family transporter [Aeromicrobium duanguangcaii]MCD9155384.1 EamA family transporter [Aeromicrobium duanguangcaii]MCL3838352.1 EamA family transporter [Aeromicrobium duanguangcaii]UUI68344.1 EamA family transporter [Aeromicrobium duanguangcaii]